MLAIAAVPLLSLAIHAGASGDWPTYGRDAGGTRYSALKQIDTKSVGRLRVAWISHTGALSAPSRENGAAAFEATPVLWNRTLYLSTPFDQVLALDAVSGRRLWFFDPKIDRSVIRSSVTSRGVALWHESNSKRKSETACSVRVFVGTIDARLFALDARSGKPCADFGVSGALDLTANVHFRAGDDYEVTSPPTVVGDVLAVGSSIGDNRTVDEEMGIVRGFDVRSGKCLWTWDPIPWASKQPLRTGAGNAWSIISADRERGILYIPTGSASPDFYGGFRGGDNRDADSVVALNAATGKKIWSFQVVHHDLWDYDVAAQPLLFEFRGNVPAVAISTKMGMVFVLNRLTGTPLFPVVERATPKSTIPGEQASRTQPFSSLPALIPQTLARNASFGLPKEDQKYCTDLLNSLYSEGIYTPPRTDATLLYPGSIGGVNWSSTAFDPQRGLLIANTNRVAFQVRLIPRREVDSALGRQEAALKRYILNPHLLVARLRQGSEAAKPNGEQNRFAGELSKQEKTPYYIFRQAIMGPSGLPCAPQPWGTIAALNLNTGQRAWETPLSTMIAGQTTGSINLGGPIVTAGGLIFDAATLDPYIRAFDTNSGKKVWEAKLDAAAQSTPMTYSVDGKQYVVICAGGYGGLKTKLGDSVVAFALDEGVPQRLKLGTSPARKGKHSAPPI